jgi:3-phenylpropionate/trans-cinnamate dioxygenase ferredoxin reductase subunit
MAVAAESERSGPDHIVIVGAGAAGTAATLTLRQHGHDGPIVLVDPDPDAPYDRPNLSKDFLAGTAPAEWLPLPGTSDWEALNVERVVAAADRLDTPTRTMYLADGRRISYDVLVLATGATSRALLVPGNGRSHVHMLRSLNDCMAIRERATVAQSAVVVGAGFLGLEVAASLRTLGLPVQVVAPELRPFERVFGTTLSSAIQRLHQSRGVVFHLGRTVTEIREDEVLLSDGTCVPADLVVVAVGATPLLRLAVDAGLAVDDGVLVNRYMQSTADSVYAVGDIARFPHPGTRGLLRIEHWAVAQAQGRVAALHILGREVPFRDIPFFWTQQYDVSIACSGFPQAWDEVVESGTFEEGSASYRLRADGVDVALATVLRDTDSLRWEIQQARRIASVSDGP